MTPSPVLIDWRGVTLGAGAYQIRTVSGWLGSPGGTYESTVSPVGHGLSRSPVRQGERVVMAAGFLKAGRGGRDAALADLNSYMVPARSRDTSTEPLTVTMGGQVGTADAQLIAYAPIIDEAWSSGMVKWQAQWRCPDPRIFGDTRYASANLYVAPTGLTLPQTLPVTLTAQALGGTVTVFNPGTDPEGSPAIFGLSGEQQANVGLHNATTGKRVLFSFPLSADDTLAVDTERGGAYLNGEYRPTTGFSDMVSDMRLAPGVNVIRALGYAGSTGTPALTVSFRPASW